MRLLSTALALTLLTATTAACSGDDERPADPAAVQTIDPSEATKLTWDDLDVTATLPATIGESSISYWAFASDHEVLGIATPREKPDLDQSIPGRTTAQSRPVVYDLTTKKLATLEIGKRQAPTQVGDISGDADTIVWIETRSRSVEIGDFTIHSYDRSTRTTTTIARFDDPEGKIVYSHDLVLSGGTAYFSTSSLPDNRGDIGVYAVPVDGSSPASMLVPKAARVRLSEGTLTYQADVAVKGSPTMQRDLRTGKTTPAPVGPHADDPVYCGGEVTDLWTTWCLESKAKGDETRAALLTIKEKDGRTTHFEAFPTDASSLAENVPAPHSVVRLGRWTGVTLTSDAGQDREFLFDLDTKAARVFPENTSFGALTPDRSSVLVSSFAGKGPGPQRIVRIPS